MEPDTYCALPMFPVPEYTLFPDTLAPFHVYEQRYSDMLTDAIAGQRLVVVAAAGPGGGPSDPSGAPARAVCGLGRVISDRRYADGRLDLFVHGLERVRIAEIVQRVPWTCVDVAPLDDVASTPTDSAHRRLVSVMSLLVASMGDEAEHLGEVLSSARDAAVLTNRLAAALVDDFEARQALLEQRCPARRCDALVAHVGGLLLRLDRGGERASTWVN